MCLQETAVPEDDVASEQTTLLTGPIQGDVVTINQKPLDLMLLQVDFTSALWALFFKQQVLQVDSP